MSHLVSIKTELRDIDCAALAAKELGGELIRDAKQGRWFGKFMDDYDGADAAYKLGIDPKEYGKADHIIRFADSAYDVMLLKNPATGGYRIYFDFWGGNGKTLQNHIGKNGETLLKYYAAHKTTMEAQKKGWLVTRTIKPTGEIKLQITGC